MKLLQTFSLLLILLSAAFASCKKEATERPYVLEGNWEGTVRANGSSSPGFYGLRIKAGHVLERYNSNGQTTATGTWQLNNNSFSGTYTYEDDGTVLTVSGMLDKATNKLSGTYENDGDGSGTWSATKK